MAGLCEGGNEPLGSLKASIKFVCTWSAHVLWKSIIQMYLQGFVVIDLPKYIEYLESSLLQLEDAIGVTDSLLQKQVPGPVGEAITLKLKKVLQRNPGFEKMKNRFVGTISMDHPPYSPDLAPSDFHLFTKLKKFLGGKCFGSDDELNAVNNWIKGLAADDYNTGILKLVNLTASMVCWSACWLTDQEVPSSIPGEFFLKKNNSLGV
ncbi:hypothetical protein ANN_22814 [Periplaneta americana]|uniref:Per a allergen n=1 Tax=Periplaneta americana TaxID=6978 RepID=A0ABQ8SJH8_PERAM|nr:hypothetical protein ANN_22814 [Periplaneta americana]